MIDDSCQTSATKSHEWRPYLSGGYKCVHCAQEWLPAEPCVDPDEVDSHRPQDYTYDPLWPKILGVVIAIIVIVLVFAPVGMDR